MYSRIIAPIDGSAVSTRACAEAIRLAVDQKAALRLVHVVSFAFTSAVLGGAQTADLLRRLREDARQILDEAETSARKAGLTEVESRMIEHHAAQIGEAIIEDAKKWNAELIVMGTHGRRGFARIVMGSDAEYVARHARVPVLLVCGASN